MKKFFFSGLDLGLHLLMSLNDLLGYFFCIVQIIWDILCKVFENILKYFDNNEDDFNLTFSCDSDHVWNQKGNDN